MAIKSKATGRAVSMPLGLVFGAAVSLGITLFVSAVLAKLVDSEKMTWENIGYGIMIQLFAASFLGAMTAYGKIKRQRLLVCAISGAVYLVLLLAITAVFFGGQYKAVGVTAALVLAGSGTAGLLGLSGTGRGGHKKIQLRHR